MLKRPRRLRRTPIIREMVSENTLQVSDLIYPLFVVEGENIKEEISTLPGVYHFSIDQLDDEIAEIQQLGIQSIILFGIPNHKDECGSESFAHDGIIQRAVRHIKSIAPELCVITDVCMCEYTSHGHCGILTDEGYVDNDQTLDYLAKIAVSQAEAGADMVAPSDMMDGHVKALRDALDNAGFTEVAIMSYSVKYASYFYGPFREAAHSAPSFGDRRSYQMDPRNAREALIEAQIDIDEGTDFLMVKPALPYLDVVRQLRDRFDLPIVTYNVSGEYAMLKMAVDQGLLDENAIYEALISMKRAGADIIITYFAKDVARRLQGGNHE